MDKREKLCPVVSYLPPYCMAGWAQWCQRHGLTQAGAIRAAIADYIYNDETATNPELALAGMIEDIPLRPYRLRNGGVSSP